MRDSHIHSAPMTGLVILAWVIVWHFLLRTVAAHHANNKLAQAVSVLS